MGGQVGDSGVISAGNNEAEVVDTIHPEAGLTAHVVKVIDGEIKAGDEVELQLNAIRRAKIRRNHTATHILHWALRQVLGDHVKQAGSFVSDERLRFDFTHFEGVSDADLAKVEKLANEKVACAMDVQTYETSLDDARAKGVTALFGEKYGEVVRVVNVGDFSSELCAGCHAANTAEIGLIKITSESSVGSNARRIEAVTSMEAYNYLNERNNLLNDAAAILRCPVSQVTDRVNDKLAQIKQLEADIKNAQKSQNKDILADALKYVSDVAAGYKLLIHNLGDLQGSDIKHW